VTFLPITDEMLTVYNSIPSMDISSYTVRIAAVDLHTSTGRTR